MLLADVGQALLGCHSTTEPWMDCLGRSLHSVAAKSELYLSVRHTHPAVKITALTVNADGLVVSQGRVRARAGGSSLGSYYRTSLGGYSNM